MNVDPPIYIEDGGLYRFFLTDGPFLQYTIPCPIASTSLDSYVQMDTILFRTQLAEVVDDFLDKSSDYFTTPISVSTFLDGLQHKWTDPYGILQDRKEESLSEQVDVQWTPVQASIGIEFYEIVWALHGLDPGTQQSEEQPEEQSERQSEEQSNEQATYTTPATTESSLLEPVDLSSLPCIDTTMEESDLPSVLRARDRRLIRETRLQAELLYLRSKRLAQRYLNKYATTNVPDTESNLSFSSDGEDI